MRWPGIGRRRFVLQPETAGSRSPRQVTLLIGDRRRVEHSSRARRVDLLTPTPQDHRQNKGIRLGKAISHVWGWAGGVDCWGAGVDLVLSKLKLQPRRAMRCPGAGSAVSVDQR